MTKSPFVPGYLFFHKSLGLCMTITSKNEYVDAYIINEKRKVVFLDSFLLRFLDENKTRESITSLEDIIKSHALDHLFDEPTIIRAEHYINSRFIKNVNISQFEITAEVEGQYLYKARIYLDDVTVKMSCSCPVNGNCKHLYALIQFIIGEHKKRIDTNSIDRLFEIYSIRKIEDVERLEKCREELLNTPVEDIISYFNHHQYIKKNNANYSHNLLIFDNTLFNRIIDYYDLHKDIRPISEYLKKIKEIRTDYYKNKNRYYYEKEYIPYKAALFYLFNQDYVKACLYLKEVNISNGQEYLEPFVCYYIDSLLRIDKNVIHILLNKSFINLAFNRINDEDNKRYFYIIFSSVITNKAYKITTIESFEIYKELINGDYEISTYKNFAKGFISNISKYISENDNKEVLDVLISLYKKNIVAKVDFKRSLNHLNNNSMVKYLFEDFYGF